jgi:hypothetical protein
MSAVSLNVAVLTAAMLTAAATGGAVAVHAQSERQGEPRAAAGADGKPSNALRSLHARMATTSSSSSPPVRMFACASCVSSR